jgi:signal transduction histidine kinase
MRILSILLGALLLGVVLSDVGIAEEKATRDECIAMTKAAAKMLEADKAAGIKEINNPKGKFVWKDSYVFLMDKSGKMLAHPFIPQLLKKDTLFNDTDYNQVKPKKIFTEFVEVAFNNGQGWVDYKWPKPNKKVPSDKFTFILRVGWTDMIVGAGTYLK